MTDQPVESKPSTDKPFVKPECTLIGQDGNVFNLIGIAAKALKRAGYPEKAAEMTKRAFSSGSYGAVLVLLGEYVDIQ